MSQVKKDALADHLRAAILTQDIAPGTDLDEAQLSAQFGLSRTPLREIFRDLAGEGYLSQRANRGTRVAELSHTTLRAFFQAAPMLYSAILRLAAENASIAQMTALKDAQHAFQTALTDGTVKERALANNRFHDITGDMAGNIYLLPSFHRLLIDHARISMTFYRPQNAAMQENTQTASRQHDAIIEAIERRDSDTAAALAQAHWELSRSQIELFVMPDALNAELGTLSEKRPA